MNKAQGLVAGFLLVFLLAGESVWGSPVTPQRPSFSADPSTTALGTLELEMGIVGMEGELMDVPATLKWGASNVTEIFLGWSPYLKGDPDGGASGVGDVLVGTRYRFREEGRGPAAAVQAAIKVPVADEDKGLGSGEVDFILAGTVSKAFDSTTLVGYYQISALGSPDGGDGEIEHGLALAAGHPLAPKWGGFVELSVVVMPQLNTEALVSMFGVGYTVQPDWAFDAAVALGLTDDADDFSFVLGTTVNFGP